MQVRFHPPVTSASHAAWSVKQPEPQSPYASAVDAPKDSSICCIAEAMSVTAVANLTPAVRRLPTSKCLPTRLAGVRTNLLSQAAGCVLSTRYCPASWNCDVMASMSITCTVSGLRSMPWVSET